MSAQADTPRAFAESSYTTVYKKPLGSSIASLVFGVTALSTSYVLESPRSLIVLGWLAVLFAVIQFILWRMRPLLVVAPWGIVHRATILGDAREDARGNVLSWMQTSDTVVINVEDASPIRVLLHDIRRADAPRLMNALRDYGYAVAAPRYNGA